MTKDEIIEMARQVGAVYNNDHAVSLLDDEIIAFAKLVAEKERDKVTKERDRMCEHCKWRNDENSTLDETNQSKVLGKG
jgi:hypothetical protein